MCLDLLADSQPSGRSESQGAMRSFFVRRKSRMTMTLRSAPMRREKRERREVRGSCMLKSFKRLLLGSLGIAEISSITSQSMADRAYAAMLFNTM